MRGSLCPVQSGRRYREHVPVPPNAGVTLDSHDVWRATAGAAVFLAKEDTTDITEVRNVPSLPSFRQEGADG